jgi:hypothetical protein
MIQCVAVLTALLIAGLVWAQEPAKSPVKPSTVAKAAACDDAAVDASGLTECARLKLHDYQATFSTLQGQMNELQRSAQQLVEERQAFVKRLIDAEPGKQYEGPSQQFPLGRLVPKPATAAPAAGKK